MAEPIPKTGWLDRVAHGLDNFIAAVSPGRALTRLRAREAFTHFRRDAARFDLDRERIYQPLRSPDSARDQLDRMQIIREARDCEENIPFVSGLFLLFFTYLFETLTYEPDTGDPGMDSEIDAYFNEMWMGQADAFLVHAFPVLFGLTFCGSLRDGDGGLAFVDDGTMLRLAAVEADQIGEANTVLMSQQDYVAGVWLNPDGTRRGYQVYDRLGDFRYGNAQFIPVASFVYLADARRPTAKRNTSILAPIINNLRDKYEAMNIVKVTLKRQLEDAFAAFTETGRAPVDFGAPPAVESRGGEQLRSITKGGITTYFGQGDKLVPLENRHINDNFLNFIKTIDTENCNGLHLPYGFVVDNADPGGAGVRMVLHRTSREFGRLKGKIIRPALNRIRDMVLLYAMDKGDISKHPKFQGGEWMFPPPPTADMQRESETDIAEIEAGLTTRTEIAAMWGQRQKRTVRTLAREERMRLDAAAEFNVDPQQIYTTSADTNAAKRPAPTGQADGHDDKMKGFESLKAQFDAYGVAVRAGSITPQEEDEIAAREAAGLPPLSAAAKVQWEKEGGIRRPITLAGASDSEVAGPPKPSVETEAGNNSEFSEGGAGGAWEVTDGMPVFIQESPGALSGGHYAVVRQAHRSPLVDAGQLTDDDKDKLDDAVRSGIIVKGMGGPYSSLMPTYGRSQQKIVEHRQAGRRSLARGQKEMRDQVAGMARRQVATS